MRAFKIAFAGATALVCLLGFAFPLPHPHFWWQSVPVFDALFALLGCLLILLLAKMLRLLGLRKKEETYD